MAVNHYHHCMIRTVTGLLVVGLAIMAMACGIIEEADPTPPTETLAGAPEWAIQENLIASSRILRDFIFDFGERGTIEIDRWSLGQGVTLVQFHSTGGAERLMDHVLIRDGDVVYPRLPGGTIAGRVVPPRETVLFSTDAWASLSGGDGVMEIYE